MMKSLNYSGLLDAMTQAINHSVVAVRVACTAHSLRPSSASPLDTIREAYNSSVKPHLVAGSFGVESLTREVGGAYGELCTHLMALIASWNSYRDAGNRRIELVVVQNQTVHAAAAHGWACLESVSGSICRTMHAEAKLKSDADLFASLVSKDAEDTGKTYNPPHACYVPMGIALTSLTSNEASYSFGYWSGDMQTLPLGFLYSTAEDQRTLARLAAISFNRPVRVTPNCNGIALI